jgi:hypothetical protein
MDGHFKGNKCSTLCHPIYGSFYTTKVNLYDDKKVELVTSCGSFIKLEQTKHYECQLFQNQLGSYLSARYNCQLFDLYNYKNQTRRVVAQQSTTDHEVEGLNPAVA